MSGGKKGDFGNTKGNALDAISDLLTVASLIPGIDTLADALAIPVDLLRGDFASAGLDLLGVIPFVGEVGDTAKLAKLADKGIDAVKTLDKSNDVVKKTKKSKNIINKQKKGTPRNNKAQNKQTSSVAKRLKLTPKQQRELHDLIHGQNFGYQEILDFAKEWFNK